MKPAEESTPAPEQSQGQPQSNPSPTTPPTPPAPQTPASPLPTTAPVSPTPAPPPPQPPQPKKSRKKAIIISLIVGIPLAFLLYRLAISYYYSPENAYQRNKSKIENQGKQELVREEAEVSKLAEAMIKIAPTIPADELVTPTRDVVDYKRNTGTTYAIGPPSIPTGQQELKGVLTPVPGTGKIDGCYHLISYGGSKFNQYPVGEEAACKARVTKAFVWTGSKAKLEQLMKDSAETAGFSAIKGSSYSYSLENEGISYGIANVSDSYLTRQYTSNEKPLPGDWTKIFTNESLGSIPTLSTSPTPSPSTSTKPGSQSQTSSQKRTTDERYVVYIYSSTNYYTIYKRSL